ncbi:MAG: low affinity iron permease family protein [Candidatus Nomurabacteria bacterium]|nr:MAG: low affinity iron permease family protein [Candidatus Nomurabacteria bacterium]HRV75901.1 low affinity iron permease family protein [Candidatus Saccharimonadales bacterium]
MSDFFHKVSTKISNATGKASAFILSVLVVLIWASVGPLFNYSDTWQLVINTGTTVVTFLMVFLIQNTQNRDSKSIHLKLDELIRTQKNASNAFMDLDSRTDQELVELEEHFAIMSSKVTGEKLERLQKKEVNEHRLHIFKKDKSKIKDRDGDGLQDPVRKK